MRTWRPVPLAALLLLLAGTGPLCAQQLDTSACEAVSSAAICATAAELAAVMAAHGAMIASGGNPVAGTASTLGQRVPGMPRVSLDVRRVAGSANAPDGIGGGSIGTAAWTGAVTIGLYNGLSPMSTVGGLFSLDFLAGLSLLRFRAADGFTRRSPTSWAVGARVGILRESFTMPGISLSLMHRRTARLTYGEASLATGDFQVDMERVGSWSARAVVGKRLGAFNFNGGIGWDRHGGRGEWSVRGGNGNPVSFDFDGLHARRTTVFGGVSWTSLVFNLSAEAGRQSGTAGARGAAADGGWFWGLAARITF